MFFWSTTLAIMFVLQEYWTNHSAFDVYNAADVFMLHQS